MTIGELEPLTPSGVSGGAPLREAMETLTEAVFPLDEGVPTAEQVGTRTVVRLPLAEKEALFGMGLQFMRLNHRGRTRYLRVNSDPRQDTGETHAPVPFYVSSRGYGLLVDTARIVTICCGSSVRADSGAAILRDRSRDPQWEATPPSRLIEIVFTGGAELLLFGGPTMLEAVRRYNLYHGGGTLPPRWGLGFWHRVHYQYTQEQAKAEAQEYRSREFPCDVIGLEPGWQTKSYPCSFEWAADRFPDPAGFVAEMGAEGFRINLWEHGYISPDASIYDEMQPYAGSHTVWGGLVPDWTLPEARRLLGEQHERDHLEIGVSGYKLDECDGSELTGSSWMFPAHATFPSGHDGEQMRQVYGLYLQKITADLFHKRNRRTYGLVRASGAGASSLPYVLYSDLYDHREFVRALCNVGFSGLLWTPEIRDARDAEEWVRRMQVVCFSPMALLNAWSSSVMPWTYPEVEEIIRKFMSLRMRLLPYLYSAFARYHFDGTPPFRALALEPGVTDADGNCLAAEVDDAYMMGDSLLVAPVFAGQRSREVYLPEGTWHDFETGAPVAGGRRFRIYPGLETLPLYVRAGGIVPLMPPMPRAPRAGETVPLEIRHYGSAPGVFQLFDDDGETFDYERGACRWRTLKVSIAPDGSRRRAVSPVEKDFASAYREMVWRFFG
jgi:alpha-D-xyloside xylohydrolase